jgi:hypothetical protein
MPAVQSSEPFLIDARPLVAALRDSDDRVARVVFALLGHYLENGPFEFDATAIAEQMDDVPAISRLNPEKIAALQPEIERFFEQTPQGWVPRRGVLALN